MFCSFAATTGLILVILDDAVSHLHRFQGFESLNLRGLLFLASLEDASIDPLHSMKTSVFVKRRCASTSEHDPLLPVCPVQAMKDHETTGNGREESGKLVPWDRAFESVE